MAAFGSGLGPDPRAEARAAQLAEASKIRQASIARLGKGKTALEQGVGAVGVVGGEHLGAALAGAFGMKQPVSPEMEAANKQAELIEQINMIEGDPTSADYAKQAAKLAMDAGNQQAAYGFIQTAGERTKAEGQLAIKSKLAAQKVDAENFSRIPASMKMELFASGDDAAYNMVNIPEGPERQAMMAKATEQIENELLRVKASVRDVRRSLGTSVSTSDMKSGRSWMTGANVSATDGWRQSEADVEAMNEGVSMLVSSGANLLRTESQDTDNPLSDSEAKDLAFKDLVDSGRIIVEVGEGESMWGMVGEPLGKITVIGFGGEAPTADDEQAPTRKGRKRKVILK